MLALQDGLEVALKELFPEDKSTEGKKVTRPPVWPTPSHTAMHPQPHRRPVCGEQVGSDSSPVMLWVEPQPPS